MICKVCGTENEETANFCRMCATKLKTVCDCWVKKEPYNCGQDQCPGYKLLINSNKLNDSIGYRICVLGETLEQAQHLIHELACENVSQIRDYKYRNRICLDDGTVLVACSARAMRRGCDGHRFDEIFVGGTSMAYSGICHIINILDCCCGHSQVPKEFRWHYIED